MRAIFAPFVVVSTVAAANSGADRPDVPSINSPAPIESASQRDTRVVVFGNGVVDSAQDEACRDRITQARQEAGKPPLLDREPASPGRPFHIYAVDRRQDGCAVMVIAGDPADIRPLPAAPDGPLLIMPLGAGK